MISQGFGAVRNNTKNDTVIIAQKAENTDIQKRRSTHTERQGRRQERSLRLMAVVE